MAEQKHSKVLIIGAGPAGYTAAIYAARERAGAGAYVIIRDVTCRLFGYHGLVGESGAFSLEHMFGF